jgi:hypothetical protein
MIRPGVMVAVLCQQLPSLGRSSYLARLCYTGRSLLTLLVFLYREVPSYSTWLVFVIQVDPFLPTWLYMVIQVGPSLPGSSLLYR